MNPATRSTIEPLPSDVVAQVRRDKRRKWRRFGVGLAVRLLGLVLIWLGDGSPSVFRKAVVALGVVLSIGGIAVLRYLLISGFRKENKRNEETQPVSTAKSGICAPVVDAAPDLVAPDVRDHAYTMTSATDRKRRSKPVWRRWILRGFVIWATISTLWLANSYRTRGVPDGALRSSPTVSVGDGATVLEFLPTSSSGKPALVFMCGSGVSAHAYAPLLRPVAEAGYAVFVVKLPYRFAPLASNKQAAVKRASAVLAAHPEISHWVISGHSLGGAMACRLAQSNPKTFSAMVLVGTTHPKQDDLSSLAMPVTKVYASNDGVAPPDRTLSNKRLLPKDTQWVEIQGGNHSQFGHYGHQLLDGKATISREAQQTATRSALLEALAKVAR